MNNISLGVAFVAGIFSFLSPCVLPLIPGYISFISGVSFEELSGPSQKKRFMAKVVVTAVAFVLGFSVVFVALGASATILGQVLIRHIHMLTRAAGIIIVILGLHLTGVFRIRWLEYQKKMNVNNVSPGIMGAFLVGLAFAFGWTPCIGPILGGILVMAASEGTVTKGISLLGMYSLGLGIPFIVTAFATGFFLKLFGKYRRFIRWGEIAAGIFLVIVGIIVFFDKMGVIGYYIGSLFGASSP
jgi:cytochrome c-type biogenesis protein